MKMTKKIMLGLAVAVAALTLVGCADALGAGKTSGTKWNKTMTVDGSEITTTYRRFIKKLSTSEEVTEIKTTISLDESCVLTSDASGKSRNAVVGLAFDFHTKKAEDGTKTYDFVLIGYAPATGKYYIEKYENVAEDKAKGADKDDSDGFDTDDGSMGPYVSFVGSSLLTIGTTQVADDWHDVPATAINEDKGLTIQIKQDTNALYDVYLGDTLVAKHVGTTIGTDQKKEKSFMKAIGGAAVYANAPKGCVVKAKYSSDKKETVGLFADDEE